MSLNLNSLTVTNAINGSITGNAATASSVAATNITGTVAISSGGTGAATTTANAFFVGPNGSAGAPSFRVMATSDIPASIVTFAKLQDIAGPALVGRLSATSGPVAALGSANARTAIGATTVGSNLITLADTSTTKKYIEINADNTVTLLEAAAFRTAIGAGTGGGGVTSVTGTAPIASSGGATPVISLNDAGVTYAKIQNVSVTSRVLGRITAGAGVIEELTGANIAQIIGANTITNATNSTNATTAANVSAAADAAIVNQHNGNSAAWYGRILSKNSTSDKSSFIGTYGSIAGVFAHNNALSAWADLYINTVDGSGGGTVRLPATVLLNGNQVLTTASTLSTANLSGTVTVSNGGTGATTFTAGYVLFGNGTSAIGTNVNLFWDNTNSRLGIGTSPASPYRLDVNGTIHYTTITASSDVRFKKNVQVISNPLSKLSSVRGVRFEWNEFINARRDGYELNKPTFGVVAQELEEVFPELVSHWKLSDDCPDARSVNYEKIIPVLIEAVKELDNKNKLLEARILALENK